MLVSNIKSYFTFENFKNFVIRILAQFTNNNFRNSEVLPGKLVVMVTLDNPGNQKITFLMFHKLILNFQLPSPKCLNTVVKIILGGHHGPSPCQIGLKCTLYV